MKTESEVHNYIYKIERGMYINNKQKKYIKSAFCDNLMTAWSLTGTLKRVRARLPALKKELTTRGIP